MILAYIRCMSAVCPRQLLMHVRRMFVVCSSYVRRMFAVCSPYVRRMSADHSPYVRRIFAICPPYIRHMSAIPNLPLSPKVKSWILTPFIKSIKFLSSIFKGSISKSLTFQFYLFVFYISIFIYSCCITAEIFYNRLTVHSNLEASSSVPLVVPRKCSWYTPLS